MKIKHQVSARVVNRLRYMSKALVGMIALTLLKSKMVDHVLKSNSEDLLALADKRANFDWTHEDHTIFETDYNILAQYGLPVAMAQDEVKEEGAATPCDPSYKKDEWMEMKCERVESANGFVEEYYDEMICSR
jgi:hypothetical protein